MEEAWSLSFRGGVAIRAWMSPLNFIPDFSLPILNFQPSSRICIFVESFLSHPRSYVLFDRLGDYNPFR